MILDTFPTPEEFYRDYWNKKPFLVRNYIASDFFGHCITGDELAGLAMEEQIRARLIHTIRDNPYQLEWSSKHGPFEEETLTTLEERDWSLLVQNVDQYHEDTASLLNHFDFAPRWLIDDIMISYSTPGGSVGPHKDSYHVFLVQGIGKRSWKVSNEPIALKQIATQDDHLILGGGFAGQAVTVEQGDVLYIPPHFAHEGTTLETAMTLSVGFLGPKLSELYIEYGHYLAETDDDIRFSGTNLSASDQGYTLSKNSIDDIKCNIIKTAEKQSFETWLAQYFSEPTHCDKGELSDLEHCIDKDELKDMLENGQVLKRNSFTRCVLSEGQNNKAILAINGDYINYDNVTFDTTQRLLSHKEISSETLKKYKDTPAVYEFVAELYNASLYSSNG